MLVWLDQGSSKLGPKARSAIDQALQNDQLAVAAITFWEAAMLEKKGRLYLQQHPAAWRRDLLTMGVQEIAMDGAVGVMAAGLKDFHADPADRMIVATALRIGATLLTADERIMIWQEELSKEDTYR